MTFNTSRGIRRRLACVALCWAAIVAACATHPESPDYWDTVCRAWHGQEAIELWRAWGVPTKVVAAPNGNEMHTYISNVQSQGGGSSVDLGSGVVAGSHSSRTLGCETVFEIDSAKLIVTSSWRGTDCPESDSDGYPEWMAAPIGF